MPQQTKVFRVFVSSTFADMKEERELLQKTVFPQLEEFCKANGTRFQAIDLRWGVNEESQLNQKTLDICLKEIARCQRISPKPNFLVLLGNRYGWQPIPAIIPRTEMEQISLQLSPEGKQLLSAWYRLDENAVPPVYVLQGRKGANKEYGTWEAIEKQIRSVLRAAVDNLEFTAAQRIKYFTSATHQEIINGALNPPQNVERPEEHILALSRTISGLPDDLSAESYMDFAENKPDGDCSKKLAGLKNELQTKLGKNFRFYAASWKNGQSSIDHPSSLANSVHAFLKGIIEQQMKEVITQDEIKRENTLHGEFKARLTEHFRGRGQTLDQIQGYLRGSEKRVLSMIGPSGSGKSSVMAEAIRRFEKDNPGTVTVYRFIGITAASATIVPLLQNICGQIAREFNTTLEALAGKESEKALIELNGLSTILAKVLALATEKKPVVLFLDALDQLTGMDSAKSLRWLTKELPDHAKIVISALPELEGSLDGTRNEHLPLLPVAEAEQVLDLWFKSIGRRLTPEQRAEITGKYARTQLPIYLRLAFERAKDWHSYDERCSLQEEVPGIIHDFFDDLETEHTRPLVRKVLSYMLCGRYGGLAEDEFLETLVFDEEFWKKEFLPSSRPEYREMLKAANRIPCIVWSRLFLDLEPYLTERDANGVSIITVFHRQFIDVQHERYVADSAPQRHSVLAAYFASKPAWMDKAQRRPNIRSVTELVHHQLAAKRWDELEQTLTSLDFLEAKVGAGLAYELPDDFRRAKKTLPSDRPQRRILELLEEAIRREINFIANHALDYPQALFQCVWNQGWWYDCPNAEKHFEMPAGGRRQQPQWERSGPKLSALLERWRVNRGASHTGARWLRSHRPPPVPLTSPLTAVLSGHGFYVRSVAFSPDGNHIASGSWDKTVRLWDTASGAASAVLQGHDNGVESLGFSPDGKRVVSGALDKTVRLWDASSGAPLAVLRGHEAGVCSVAFSPDGTRIISGSQDKTVRLWDAASGAALAVMNGHKEAVSCVAFSPDGTRIISGSGDSTIRLWDAVSGAELVSLPGHRAMVTSVAFSPDGTRFVSGSHDLTARLWDAASGASLATLDKPVACVESVMFSPDGSRIICGYWDRTVRLWDASTQVELAVLRGHEEIVSCATISRDGEHVVSGSHDGTVRLWAAATKTEPETLRGHEGKIHSVAFSHDGSRVISGGTRTLRLWDTDSGLELAILQGHKALVSCAAFSPDGKRLASGSADKTVRFWDAVLGLELAVLTGHENTVQCVAFSPNGKWLVSGSHDRTVRLWDAASGAALLVLAGPEDPVSRVGFSQDGERIISLSLHSDATDKIRPTTSILHVWDARSGICLEANQEEAGNRFANEAGLPVFPLFACNRGAETILLEKGRIVAQFPNKEFRGKATHPSGRTWADGFANYLSILSLEEM